ncbi:MAG: hypothetical protein M9916_01895 [Crocinitomicaceae bacterium]|nr:hypothetical protein [Crocinitomicaceae bacterium]
MMTASLMIDLANKHMKTLESEFKPLTEAGKLECLIYNLLICNFSAQSRYDKNKIDELNFDLFGILISDFKLYVDETDDDKIGELIESRFKNHFKDIVMILDEGGFDPNDSFWYMYRKPLTYEAVGEIDPEMMAKFRPVLEKMSKALLEEADNLPD